MSGCEGSLSQVVYNALWDLYNSTNGIHWTWSTQLPASTIWTFPSSLSTPCSNDWQGLTCSRESQNTCSLEKITLSAFGLSGFLPSSLGNIASLTLLELMDNAITGSIPSELGNLPSMQYLHLDSNSLTGSIPSELGNLQSTRYLILYSNSFTGTIPCELGNLQAMTQLDLDTNYYLTGTIPRELGYLESLEYLYLYSMGLTGTIPGELGNLEWLEILKLNYNCLTGTIPYELGYLESLQYLYLYSNCLTGTVPHELGNLWVYGLYLNSNSLSGTIPPELGNLQSAAYFRLGINSLTGAIPSELGSLRSVTYLELDTNSLTGTVPCELGNLQSVIYLHLDANSLTGIIPCELGYLQSLQYLYLDSNRLTGTIPSDLGNLSFTSYMDLYSNSLTGTIPTELGNLQSVKQLDLDTNSLTGTIPCELGNLQLMQFLYLYSNSLTGSIPFELGNLRAILVIMLFDNRLTGVLSVGGMSNLTSLSVSQNWLTGSIPIDLMNLNKTLLFLYLFDNLLTGVVSNDIFSMSVIENVDFSNNFITGGVNGLVNLPLASQINAANNFLEGSMPDTYFNIFLESIDLSNNFLDGSLGSQLYYCSGLTTISLRDNRFTGALPHYLLELPLQAVDISNNALTGSLPGLIYVAIPLQTFDFSSNRLTGSLPPVLFCLSSLVSMNASNNRLSGDLSGQCRNGSLQSLDLSSNRLSGTLPPELFELKSLQDVLLFNNCFSGSLPASICSNDALEYLVLNHLSSNCGSGIPLSLQPIFRGVVSRRLMSGGIPECIWNMSLQALILSGNGLKGTIGDFASSNSLRSLLLSGNELTGTIPGWIQTSSNLEQLDLSQNRLSGMLSRSLLVSSNASLFSISVNRLSGELPNAFFAVSTSLSLDVLNGNLFSCHSGGFASWGSVLIPEHLPISDKNYDSYICGSSLFDDYLLLGIGLMFLFLIVVLLSINARWIMIDVGTTEFAGSKNWMLPLIHSRVHLGLITAFFGVLLVLFVCLHKSSSLAQFSTHSESYLWMTTAALMRGWIPVMVLLLAVGIGETVVATICHSAALSELNMNWQSWVFVLLLHVPIHLLNIVTVVTTNSAYIYAIVEGLPREKLITIQFFLGCFKLAWNGVAIPWLLRNVTFTTRRTASVTAHQVFMSLFAFIGGPFISTFFSASDCFLYTIIPQASSVSIIDVPQYSCSSVCAVDCILETCYFECPSICQFQQSSISTTSAPTWIYSYQCSSALLLDYVPVILASMSVSGFVLPCVVIVFDMCRLWSRWAPRSVVTGEGFDVSKLGRFMRVKTVVNVTVMLTFGLASPLLGLLVVLDTVAWCRVRQVLVNKQISYLLSKGGDNSSLEMNRAEVSKFSVVTHLALIESCPASSDIYIVLSFVGVFWSLFVFDMIGDVYGNLSGGLSMLVPLLMGTVIWMLVKCRREAESNQTTIERTVTSPGIELCDIEWCMENPVRENKPTPLV